MSRIILQTHTTQTRNKKYYNFVRIVSRTPKNKNNEWKGTVGRYQVVHSWTTNQPQSPKSGEKVQTHYLHMTCSDLRIMLFGSSSSLTVVREWGNVIYSVQISGGSSSTHVVLMTILMSGHFSQHIA